ncbi:hypothetical protein B0A54_01250 [Friedmanniomyces endolithicus]|uniref:DUF7598 domain-containing protein n=1 Tax=Friedmanniomyces endolithicus TaxID=329885 RepID=A0A4U0VJ19_9PEZI|nr:hypothetical protein B0A54_01250 [Friedmanniomyces endolithicus]
MNIISLLAVVTASVVMLVKTSLESNFFFFDAVSHVLTAITGMFLLVSELSLFRPYFARSWPLLSPSHGFVTLALAMIVLGINMLGNLNNYVFRDRSKGVTARQLAQSYIRTPTTPSKSSNPFHIFTSERRQSLLPSYHSNSPISSPVKETNSPSSKYSRATDCTKKHGFSFIGRNRQSVGPKLPVNAPGREMEISAPMGVNPQFAHLVQRPDSAMHPSRTGDSEAFRWRAAS